MTRNAIHLIPANFTSRQRLYIRRQKTPFAILIDGDAATESGNKFYLSPNEVILSDGGTEGLIPKRILCDLYDYDTPGHRLRFSRLRMKAALAGA